MDGPTTPAEGRLRQTGLTLLAWLSVTLLLGAILRDGKSASMADLVATLSTGPAWNVVLALGVLALATRLCGWHDLGFSVPRWRELLKLMWFPLLALAPIFALAFYIGLPPSRALAFFALNTSLIALSEEWMFRGILYHALAARLHAWTAILLTSFAFGAVHVLNVFAFGDLGQAAGQALAAMMTGLLLLALMIRTGSIWTSVLFHMVWNFGLLLIAYDAAQQPLPEGPLPFGAYLAPLAIVTPNLVYALVLLRKVRNSDGNGIVAH